MDDANSIGLTFAWLTNTRTWINVESVTNCKYTGKVDVLSADKPHGVTVGNNVRQQRAETKMQ